MTARAASSRSARPSGPSTTGVTREINGTWQIGKNLDSGTAASRRTWPKASRTSWRCRAGARYFYVCENGLVHYCSQQRGFPRLPLSHLQRRRTSPASSYAEVVRTGTDLGLRPSRLDDELLAQAAGRWPSAAASTGAPRSRPAPVDRRATAWWVSRARSLPAARVKCTPRRNWLVGALATFTPFMRLTASDRLFRNTSMVRLQASGARLSEPWRGVARSP